LESFAESIRVLDRVRFAGVQSSATDWLPLADVVWVPSCVSGGGNAALEAMAAGRPVIGTNVPALAEIIVDGETGYLTNVGDKVALARQTHALLSDSELLTQMGNAGKKRALDRFATSVAAMQYADSFSRLAA
jgi:glycosyltransferase involved in cell wall biosynthesis